MAFLINHLTASDLDRIVEMAWEDRTPFEAIQSQFGVTEADVIALMRRELKPSSWQMWRARVHGRATKHRRKRTEAVRRFKSNRQRGITHNKITKR